MSSGIYLIKDDGSLVEMTEQPYASEDLLQRLLADHPSLLSGNQINASAPRRWLLVSRETPLASEEDGSGRWSVDHLFLDQDGVPTIVEVKRSSDTRIRREVVGQMLEYAANAVVYWPVESLISQFEKTCSVRNQEPSEVLGSFLGETEDAGTFWERVRTNLQAGKVRLVFVADYIAPELQRIVEFLNEQMNPAEVLAVQIKQYMGEGLKTLIPRVIGQTGKKIIVNRETRSWDEETFFKFMEENGGSDDLTVARAILNWAKSALLIISWGKGKKYPSVTLKVNYDDKYHSLISLWPGYTTSGTVLGIQFGHLYAKPFNADVKRLELVRSLRDIPAVDRYIHDATGFPNIPLSIFHNELALGQLLQTLNWVVQEIRSADTASKSDLQ